MLQGIYKKSKIIIHKMVKGRVQHLILIITVIIFINIGDIPKEFTSEKILE